MKIIKNRTEPVVKLYSDPLSWKKNLRNGENGLKSIGNYRLWVLLATFLQRT